MGRTIAFLSTSTGRLLAPVLLCVATGCEKFELSPYTMDTDGLPEGIHATNAAALAANEAHADDTVSFVLIADVQRQYDALERAVEVINGLPGLDLVIVAGDLTDFGLLQEYEWVIERLQHLQAPYFCAVGNHDLQEHGDEYFRRLFGPTNFVVRHRGVGFIFHDTNGLEHGNNGQVPNLPWLEQAFAGTGYDRTLAVSHVPPFSNAFDPALEAPYAARLAEQEGLLASLHGHQHLFTDERPYGDGVRYIVCDDISGPAILWIQVIDGALHLQHVPV